MSLPFYRKILIMYFVATHRKLVFWILWFVPLQTTFLSLFCGFLVISWLSTRYPMFVFSEHFTVLSSEQSVIPNYYSFLWFLAFLNSELYKENKTWTICFTNEGNTNNYKCIDNLHMCIIETFSNKPITWLLTSNTFKA